MIPSPVCPSGGDQCRYGGVNMTHLQRSRVAGTLPSTNYCTDSQLMHEIMEEVAENVGDVMYGSGVLDPIRNQMVFTLADGRKLTMTCRFG
jgi:hypothetical protein